MFIQKNWEFTENSLWHEGFNSGRTFWPRRLCSPTRAAPEVQYLFWPRGLQFFHWSVDCRQPQPTSSYIFHWIFPSVILQRSSQVFLGIYGQNGLHKGQWRHQWGVVCPAWHQQCTPRVSQWGLFRSTHLASPLLSLGRGSPAQFRFFWWAWERWPRDPCLVFQHRTHLLQNEDTAHQGRKINFC